MLAEGIRWNVRPFIGGRYAESLSLETFETHNPATERVLCKVAGGTAADVDAAVGVARERFEDGCWARIPPSRRAEVLLRLADLIVQQKAHLALLDCLEMGKPIRAALQDVAVLAPMLLRSWASAAQRLRGESAPLSGENLAFNTYEPRGVVAAITAWNFPVVNAVYKLGPALAAGNSVVLKPSEVAPSSALKLAELSLEAGLPEGVLNVVPGLGGTVGAALALHPDVSLVSFTGSSATGRRIMEFAGRSNGKPLLLECGGKSPHVVFDDTKEQLDHVAEAVAQGVLRNQGQVCAAHTRLIAQSSIKDVLLEKVVGRVTRYVMGDPLDEATTFGPLASAGQRDRVKAYIQQGLDAGAIPVLRGEVQELQGYYVTPTIFDRVDTTMSIWREEIFGPVLCVQQFDTEQEAISLANSTEYGLVATVWTRDIGRGRRLARAIRAGSVTVRTAGAESSDMACILSREPQKASGFGAELGLKGLHSYSTLKAVSFVGA